MFKIIDEEKLRKFMEDFKPLGELGQFEMYNQNQTPIHDPFVLRGALMRCGCCGQDICVRQFP